MHRIRNEAKLFGEREMTVMEERGKNREENIRSIEEITDGRLYGKLYLDQLKRDKPFLELFSLKYKAALTNIGLAEESFPKVELLYLFDDGLGGYTIEGIRRSL